MRDGIAVYAIDLRQDAPFELLFVGDANVAQHRAGELGEEASMRLSQEPCLGRKVNAKRPFGCFPSQARVSLDLWEE